MIIVFNVNITRNILYLKRYYEESNTLENRTIVIDILSINIINKI